MVKRSEQYKQNQRALQLKKGDFWQVYRFKKRFSNEDLPDLDFFTFKRELSLFLKNEQTQYSELFLELANQLEELKVR